MQKADLDPAVLPDTLQSHKNIYSRLTWHDCKSYCWNSGNLQFEFSAIHNIKVEPSLPMFPHLQIHPLSPIPGQKRTKPLIHARNAEQRSE